MFGVSEVIAIILILMITISLAGLAFMFMSTTMSDMTASAGSTVDTTTSSMMTSFRIESIDINKAYVRNTGQNVLTGLSVYVNDAIADFSLSPSSIAAGEVGTVTIYDFIAEDDTIKVTSASGFSASKKAPDPCEKAIGCWKFDETTGTTAYDSSPFRNDGTLENGASFSSGKYGNGLLLDGSNDYAESASAVNVGTSFTLSALVKRSSSDKIFGYVIANGASGGATSKFAFYPRQEVGWRLFLESGNGSNGEVHNGTSIIVQDVWTHIALVINGSEGTFFVNGVRDGSFTLSYPTFNKNARIQIGRSSNNYADCFFGGTIDEVRIYNRAIY